MTDETLTTVTLKDLNYLGKYGGSTARLDDGTEVKLCEHYASKRTEGYVDGKLREVELRLRYKDIYKQIRTIKKGHQLVARKERSPQGYQLRLTGEGYHRPIRQRK